MDRYPVIICSNKINRYGFRVLASGIKLGAYGKNPIILYAHQRPSSQNPQVAPVGKMHDIKLDESGQLVGEIEFDSDDEFAVKLEKKWKKGMLNAVSLKAEIEAVSDAPEFMLDGQQYPTIVQSFLEEISIEPVPGDADAVAMRLHYKGEPATTISLSDDQAPDFEKLFPTKTKTEMDMKFIKLAFAGQNIVSLAKDANEEQLAEAITTLVNKANETVELSAQIKTKDAEIVQLKSDKEALELKSGEEKAVAMVDAAVTLKKITPAEKDSFVELAKTNFDAVKKILDAKKGFSSISAELNKDEKSGSEGYVSLSWDEMDKKGLLGKLKTENVEVYKDKFKEKFGVEPKL